jgi:hypothetical protein
MSQPFGRWGANVRRAAITKAVCIGIDLVGDLGEVERTFPTNFMTSPGLTSGANRRSTAVTKAAETSAWYPVFFESLSRRLKSRRCSSAWRASCARNGCYLLISHPHRPLPLPALVSCFFCLTMPEPVTPLVSAIEATAFALVPLGKMAGERTSMDGNRNRNSATSLAITVGRGFLPVTSSSGSTATATATPPVRIVEVTLPRHAAVDLDSGRSQR